ncbi:hypothetical protein MMAG44476_14435 [Mycolicibacterium mageritense DSM 44476 = CIP 104973]|uniref:ESX-1 secretion-associated protein EspA/EspE-like domain-containing protein n=1 Tax=Mycolicibacterium mageritense TaxID=53462 RepID=A0ABM7HSX5_MYCME|nr:hypothetical protein [Mycolicibacterium mageritense]BBX33658.1 hypothetical protein MMAGJ_29400 [Mycolicibacterium mageritense]CDO22085.1 hypothetical protein BN978_02550 [Mycolicibacterium mageritense DSM 44476 = CIP 104973]
MTSALNVIGVTTSVASLTGLGSPDPDRLRHQAPEAGRTQYLPVSGVGGIDGDAGDADSVDAFDRTIDQFNTGTMNYQPTHVDAFCAGKGCEAGGDCGETVEGVPAFHEAEALQPLLDAFAGLHDVMTAATAAVTQQAGEPSADRLAAVYAGTTGGTFNLNAVNNATTDVEDALTITAAATHEGATNALGSLRLSVQALRNVQADRAAHHVSAAEWLLAAPLAATGVGLAVGGLGLGMNAWNVLKGSGDTTRGTEALGDAATALENATTLNDEAVQYLRAALAEWTVTPNGNSVTTNLEAPKPEATKVGDTTPIGEALPSITDPGAPSLAPALDDVSDDEDLDDKLAKLLASETPMPDMGVPSAGMPAGGGMPSMGGGGMPDMGSGMSSPLSDPLGDEELAEPLDDLSEDEDDEMEEPLDDLTDEGDEAVEPLDDPTDGLDTEPKDDAAPETAEDTGEVAPVAAVETDPNSAEARTADVGNGRQVEFPSAKLAALADTLARGAEQGLGFTLAQEASELGFQIPPDGQDIGKQVPTSLMQAGDVLVSSAGTGIFIGNDEVMMENGDIVPVSDAAVFDGQNQGIFRLDEGGDSASPTAGAETTTVATGVAQPVGDGSVTPLAGDVTPVVSTPGEATAQAGTPGVPDDEEAGLSSTDDTAAGAAFGDTDNGAGALNPDDVFPSS